MQEEKQPFQLRILLSALIDSELIKEKIKLNLKENTFEKKYYLLNFDWFKEYIEQNNMSEIYNNIVNNHIIEFVLESEIVENKEENNLIIEQVIQNLNKDLNKAICKKNNFFERNDKLSYNVEPNYITDGNDGYLFYYYNNFLLLSEYTKNLLQKYEKKNNFVQSSAYLGDNHIFLVFATSSKYIIELGNIDITGIILPEIFFVHKSYEHLKKNISSLISKGFNNYFECCLMFKNDYISPIFDQNNRIIGRAFRYDYSFQDYWIHLNEELFLNYMIKLYFSHYKLKHLLNTTKFEFTRYYLINKQYLEQNEKYSNTLNALSQNNFINQIIYLMIKENNDYNTLVDEKKIELIIKNLPKINSINNQEKISNVSFEPYLNSYNIKNDSLFYFVNLKFVEQNTYNNLFNKKGNDYQCILIDNYILINISNENRNNIILEACILNANFEIEPKYLLQFKKNDYFNYYMSYLSQLKIDFKSFIEGFSFKSNEGIPLNTIDDDKELGYIYDLSMNNNVNINISINQVQNVNNMNNNNNFNNNKAVSQINIINNNQFISNPIINNFANNNIINNSVSEVNKIIIRDPIPPPPPRPLKEEFFNNPPLIGFQNVGATCYMNATLQCFANIEKFVNFFKYNKKLPNKLSEIKSQKDYCLAESFKYLMENRWPSENNKSKDKYILRKCRGQNSNNKYFAPTEFKEKISKMNDLFKGVQANDAKDLVNFLIMTLHEELNAAPKQNNSNSNIFIDQCNKDLILNNFMLNFAQENRSLISDLFYGTNSNVTKCLNCRKDKYNYQIYFFIIFPLEEIRKSKIQQEINLFIMNNQNMMNINPLLYQQNLNIIKQNAPKIDSVDLYDCFTYNQKIDNFTNENSMYCNICQGQFPSTYQTILYTGPEILIIILNRGQGIQFKVKCQFNLNLNLYNFIERRDTGFMYDLIGVVTHMGDNDKSGHFVAFCKNPINGNWYNYNDDLVFPVNDFKRDVIDYAMPYILFYQKQNQNKQ